MNKKISFKKLLLITTIIGTQTTTFAGTHVISQTKQQSLTPHQALQKLINGNQRFVNKNMRKYNYIKQAKLTAAGQHPFAIILSCIGLFAMSILVVTQRTKEIGVRKIVGAGVTNITLLLTKDFLILVGIAFVIATPIAWYFTT